MGGETGLASTSQPTSKILLAATLVDVPRVALLNTGEPTHIAECVFDLSFVSHLLDIDATWALHDHLTSDHLATVVHLPVTPPLPPPRPARWNLQRGDWEKFRRVAARHLGAIVHPDDLDEAES